MGIKIFIRSLVIHSSLFYLYMYEVLISVCLLICTINDMFLVWSTNSKMSGLQANLGSQASIIILLLKNITTAFLLNQQIVTTH